MNNHDWFKELFIDEVKTSLGGKGGVITDEQVSSAVNDYLEENPIQSATATVENNVLVIK